ncbi:MAG TPA: hypothetical protein VN207_03915 [Ktedonobacteraceae bacterium]|nr:hypothetical protein [Ktedonobacteraceae bacterium]
MRSRQVLLASLLFVLLVIFAIAYALAIIGIAFDVKPSFAMSWAGSALLFLVREEKRERVTRKCSLFDYRKRLAT